MLTKKIPCQEEMLTYRFEHHRGYCEFPRKRVNTSPNEFQHADFMKRLSSHMNTGRRLQRCPESFSNVSKCEKTAPIL